jgi:hypothetical protein
VTGRSFPIRAVRNIYQCVAGIPGIDDPKRPEHVGLVATSGPSGQWTLLITVCLEGCGVCELLQWFKY